MAKEEEGVYDDYGDFDDTEWSDSPPPDHSGWAKPPLKIPDPLAPPASIRGMFKLDKSRFSKTIKTPCMTVEEIYIGRVVKCIKKHMLCMRNLKNILKDKPGKKTILPHPSLLTDQSPGDLKDKLQIDESPLVSKIVKI